jgi:hypothetical protein
VRVEIREGQWMIRAGQPALTAGAIVDLPDEEAKRLLERRVAIPASDSHPSARPDDQGRMSRGKRVYH